MCPRPQRKDTAAPRWAVAPHRHRVAVSVAAAAAAAAVVVVVGWLLLGWSLGPLFLGQRTPGRVAEEAAACVRADKADTARRGKERGEKRENRQRHTCPESSVIRSVVWNRALAATDLLTKQHRVVSNAL
jgi:hypothetical protein